MTARVRPNIGAVRSTFAPWADPTATPLVRFDGVAKRFGEETAVNRVDLSIYEGEFFALLGPSGCGKTTLMRMLAGFETPDEGRVWLGGRDIAGDPPHRRPVNMMFQSYALFPHLSVEKNIAFGLERQKLPKAEIAARVAEVLEMVRMAPFARRRPDQLSGGQRQRVALARAIAPRPKVLLLDEPLGALDAKLRRVLQVELRSLHREVGITFVYVTHDQEEALTMSDRLAVMNTGRIEQVGVPREVYDEPCSTYVADFLGLANLLPAEADDRGVQLLGVEVATATEGTRGPCTVLVRPERVTLVAPAEGQLRARVEHVVFAGAATHIHLQVGSSALQAVVPNDGAALAAVEGGEVGLRLAPDALRVLPA